MSSDQHVEFEGTVVFDTKGCFKIQLENGEHVNAKPSGKMRLNKIQILLGDKVIVECSIYDMKNGKIVKRLSSGIKKSATDRKKLAAESSVSREPQKDSWS